MKSESGGVDTPKVPRLQVSDLNYDDISSGKFSKVVNRIINRGWDFPVLRTRVGKTKGRGNTCTKKSLVTW